MIGYLPRFVSSRIARARTLTRPPLALRARPTSTSSGSGSSGGGGSGAAPFYVRHPLAIAITVATVKTAAADLLVQTQIERLERIDWSRVALFTAFGSLYFGAFQYFLYVKCFSSWFDAARLSSMSLRQIFAEGGAARANWLKQMGFDLFLHGHFFFPLCASLSPAWLAAGPRPTLSCPCSGLLGLMLLPLLLAADLRARLSRAADTTPSRSRSR